MVTIIGGIIFVLCGFMLVNNDRPFWGLVFLIIGMGVLNGAGPTDFLKYFPEIDTRGIQNEMGRILDRV